MTKIESAAQVAMTIAREGVQVGGLVLFHKVEDIIEARDRAVAKKVLEAIRDRIRAGQYGDFCTQIADILTDDINPAELDRLLKE